MSDERCHAQVYTDSWSNPTKQCDHKAKGKRKATDGIERPACGKHLKSRVFVPYGPLRA